MLQDLKIKRPFAKKTDDITNLECKKFVELLKDLQINSERMARQARKIKQTLKNSKQAENLENIKLVAKKLLQQRNCSLIADHLAIMSIITEIVNELGMEEISIVLQAAKNKEEQAVRLAQNKTN